MNTITHNGVTVKSNDLDRVLEVAPDIIEHYTEIMKQGELILLFKKEKGEEYLEISIY